MQFYQQSFAASRCVTYDVTSARWAEQRIHEQRIADEQDDTVREMHAVMQWRRVFGMAKRV